ncbi:cation:proton antiporter regulatory subunit [Gorillibacterium sp. CAU 1737]|uniref:cation:proton antiporter regulatory subunit n=1 Tax=Gorillibacterium sp. CAU 1737 TaxID=3140362 RepID=UPI000F9C9977
MGIIRESELPGLGKKYQLEARSGDKLVIVIHDDGRRELFHYDDHDPEESISLVTLEDQEARQVAAIIGGMTYKPKALENIEVTLEELVIDWFKLEASFKSVDKTIAELDVRAKTGATVLAIIGKNGQKINPGPEDRLVAGATIVIAGERKQIRLLKELLQFG